MWTARDGAPQGVRALSQGPDGVLWIGTEGGLYSFDGLAFHQFQSPPGEPDLPAGVVRSLLTPRDGAIWVGFDAGRIARIDHGHVTIFETADGDKIYAVEDLQQSADGGVWALSGQLDVLRFGKDGAWHLEATPRGSKGGQIYKIYIDRSNTLWLGQGGRLYRRLLDRSEYFPTDVQVDWPFAFTEEPDGSVWVADVKTDIDRGRLQHVDRAGKLLGSFPDSPDEAFDLLYAPGGSLIMAATYHGLRSFRADAASDPGETGAQAAPEKYLHTDGLSSDDVDRLLLDIDGNIWVGGKKGLDRFRTARLKPFPVANPDGHWQVCSTRQGDIWVASDTNQLYRVSGGVTKSFPNAGDIYSIFCGADGDVWVVDHAGIWRVHADTFTPVPPIAGVPPYGLYQLVATPENTLFAYVVDPAQLSGLWEYGDEHWVRLDRQGTLGTLPRIEYVDRRGRIWTGYRDGLIGMPVEGEGRVFSSGDPGLGLVYAILETSHGMFAAGLNGVATLRGDRFEMLAFQDRAAARGVAGLAESANGDLWLNAAGGLVRVRAADLAATLKDIRIPLRSERVTEGDFVGPAKLFGGKSTAGRDAQGNLWFATLGGVLHLDPGHLKSEGRPPIVSIRSVTADGTPLKRSGVVDPEPQILNIQYLGVNLTAPDAVIYRYRLDGLDKNWQDAGHRTEAIYTHLGPGTYAFSVSASNGDGVWTEPVSSARFTVAPSFYQTGWFLALCVLAAALILWLLYAIRIRAISGAIRTRAEARADERVRIAQDLHDTLLQGVQGLLLTFHVAAQKVSPDQESRAMLERALSSADKVIIEGRNRLNSLRSEHLSDAELVASLENVGKDLMIDDKVRCRVSRSGTDAVLQSHVADEVFDMAREALTNAFRHARASEIHLELTYGDRLFSMTCKDDGRGFEIGDRDKAGHWGLKGMLERAKRLRGQLHCRTAPMQGTEIVFTLPTRLAYKHHSLAARYLRTARFPSRARPPKPTPPK